MDMVRGIISVKSFRFIGPAIKLSYVIRFLLVMINILLDSEAYVKLVE